MSAMKGPSEDERRRTDAYKLAMYHTALDAHVAASGAPSGVQTRKATLVVLDGVGASREGRARYRWKCSCCGVAGCSFGHVA